MQWCHLAVGHCLLANTSVAKLQLSPRHHHCCQISTALFLGSKGEARIMPLQHLQMCQSWAGRSCFCFHIFLGTRVKKLNRSVELGQENTKHVDTSGKITKWSCQQVTLEQEGFFLQSTPNYLCFPGSKNASLSLGNHAEGLGKNALSRIPFHSPEGSRKLLFLSLCLCSGNGGFPDACY